MHLVLSYLVEQAMVVLGQLFFVIQMHEQFQILVEVLHFHLHHLVVTPSQQLLPAQAMYLGVKKYGTLRIS